MDPQAAWDEILTAIVQRDWDRAFETSEALLSWMKNGGFPPQTSGDHAASVEQCDGGIRLPVGTSACQTGKKTQNSEREQMSDRPHWSYSSINQYLRCPLQYFF